MKSKKIYQILAEQSGGRRPGTKGKPSGNPTKDERLLGQSSLNPMGGSAEEETFRKETAQQAQHVAKYMAVGGTEKAKKAARRYALTGPGGELDASAAGLRTAKSRENAEILNAEIRAAFDKKALGDSYSPQGLIAAKLLEILPKEYLSEESDTDIMELYNIAGEMLNEFESDLVICEEFTYEDALLYFIDSINESGKSQKLPNMLQRQLDKEIRESKIGPSDPSKRVIPATRSDSTGKDKEPEDHSSGSSADVFQRALEQQQKAIEAKKAKNPLTIEPIKTTDEKPGVPGYLPSKTFASSDSSKPKMPIGKGFSSAYKAIKKLENE